MVDPVSLGTLVAALIAKALDRAEDGVVDEAVDIGRRALARLRQRFAGDPEAEAAIEGLADAPDSERRAKALAKLLGMRAASSEELLDELREIVGEAQSAGVKVGPIEQRIEGDGNVQIVSLDSEVTVRPAAPRNPE